MRILIFLVILVLSSITINSVVYAKSNSKSSSHNNHNSHHSNNNHNRYNNKNSNQDQQEYYNDRNYEQQQQQEYQHHPEKNSFDINKLKQQKSLVLQGEQVQEQQEQVQEDYFNNKRILDSDLIGSGETYPFLDCVGNLEYLGVDKIQPFGFNQGPYLLKWGDGSGSGSGSGNGGAINNSSFPDVIVDLYGESAPLLVGNLHPYDKLERENSQFFDVAGKQDIRSLMHYSCGKNPSTVSFSFKEAFDKKKEFILLVFGMTPNAILNVKAYDWSGQLLPGATWQELDRGIIRHGQKDIVRMQSNLNIGRPSANLKWTGGSITTYDIFYPSIPSSKISKIELLLSHTCSLPECKGITLFYSLIANDLCVKQNKIPPTERPSATPATVDSSIASEDIDQFFNSLKPSETPSPTQPPTTEAPTTEPPTTEAPTTEAPTTEAPTTEAPTTEAPTTEAPTTEPPEESEESQEQSNPPNINSQVPNPLKHDDDDITITIVPFRHRATRPPYRARKPPPPPTQTLPSAWE